MANRRQRHLILRHTNLPALADAELGPSDDGPDGPSWPCPSCGRTALVVRPAPRRDGGGVVDAAWICRHCHDGGTAFDLLVALGRSPAQAWHELVPRAAGHSPAGSSSPVLLQSIEGSAELLVAARPGASTHELIEVLEVRADRDLEIALEVGGRAVQPDDPLVIGPTLRVGLPAVVANTGAVASLHWVRGLDSGAAHNLEAGRHALGSARCCSLRLRGGEPVEAVLEVTHLPDITATDVVGGRPFLIDGGAVGRVGRLVNGARWRVGSGEAVVVPPRPSCSTSRRVGPHVRPPRVIERVALNAVPAPRSQLQGRPDRRSSMLPVTFAAFGALVAAMVFRQPLLLLTSGLGALGMIVARLVQRHRDQADDRRSAREVAADHEAFAAAVAEQHRVALADRRSQPGAADAVARALGGDGRLWERRPGDPDAFEVSIGHGDDAYVPLVTGDSTRLAGPALVALARCSTLVDVPVLVRLVPSRTDVVVVGIVGDLDAARAVARSCVVQAIVFHGPADLAVAVCVVDGRDARDELAAWRWVSRIPHAMDLDSGEPLLAIGERGAERLAATTHDRPLLLVVDGPSLATTRNAGVRPLLAGRRGPVAGIVIAERAGDLPSICTVVIDVGRNGSGKIGVPRAGAELVSVALDGVSLSTAERVAASLSGRTDPELDAAGSTLPVTIALSDLLSTDDETDPHLVEVAASAFSASAITASAFSASAITASAFTAEAIARRWAIGKASGRIRVPIGLAEDGPVVIDLDRDGPHGLIAGTTGSGKSELLRSIVAGLAAQHGPDEVSFVLIDYKGGSAFDACAALPHVVGVVTDLDEELATRALQSLDAEMRRREQVLRSAGVSDLASFCASSPERMARLIVVVDEFATLAVDMPEFLGALVAAAQRGRSLGVHLLLATQRPGGCLSDDIRANTNLRIALRVQDRGDSIDVVGDPGAACLPRDRPGRCLVRLGHDEFVTIQAARVTMPVAAEHVPNVVVHELFGHEWVKLPARVPADELGAEMPSELDVLVEAVNAAFAGSGLPSPRRPWLDPLPENLPLADLELGAVGLADEPASQSQPAVTWQPANGNLLLLGSARSGTTTAAASLICALAGAHEPAALHLYVIDGGAGELRSLAELPHVGAVVLPAESERQRRLVKMLRAELDRRRATSVVGCPQVVLVIDGFGPLRAAFDDPSGYDVLDDLERLVVDGPEVAMTTVVTTERLGSLPSAILSAMSCRWVFRLTDRAEAAGVGVDAAKVSARPGRAWQVERARFVQIAHPGPDLAVTVRRLAPAAEPAAQRGWAREGRPTGPQPVAVLPASVPFEQLRPGHVGAERDGGLVLPLGLGDDELEQRSVTLGPGDHLLIAGPARSGRTNALAVLARQSRLAVRHATIVAVTSRRSALTDECVVDLHVKDPGGLARLADQARAGTRLVVLVDDADAVDDPAGVLAALAASSQHNVVAACRPDAARSYGSWLQLVRRSRCGLLLRPQLELDGDLLGVTLPRRRPVAPLPGRGFLVADGVVELVQVALAPVVRRIDRELTSSSA